MKKNVLALSIAAMIGGVGFAGAAFAEVVPGTGAGLTATTATALQVADGGVGHALVVPYFNAQNGNMTVLHVTNTDVANGKAVKVRFRGAANSDDILDFQVFLSPGDVWTGAVTADPVTGVAQLVTADNTCTVPALQKGVNQPFITSRLNQGLVGDALSNQTREGYVEIFNMADIPVNTASGSLYTAIKHQSGVAPCSVAGSAARTLLNAVATTNYATEAAAGAVGFDTPTAGLMGDWYIINVPQTTTFSGSATAVVAKTAGGANARGNFVHFPQQNTPVAGTVDNFTADPLLRGVTPIVTPRNYDLPDMSTPTFGGNPVNQASALTQALAVTSITNQYANDASITAKTDWVFSMPTRRYSVAADYNVKPVTNPGYKVFTALASNWFVDANTSVDAATGNICVVADSQTFYDREETTPGVTTPGPVFSPSNPIKPNVVQFCGETSVLAFADTGNSVLGASVARQNLTTNIYENGWGVINTTNGGVGLPILGASFIKLANPNAAPGVSGTYGITWPHRFTK